jgi:hypothetical protein
MLQKNASVPIAAAAEQAGVDVAQIHRWAAVDSLEIQRRGRTEVVVLDDVMALSAAARRRDKNASRGALRARLADARVRQPSVTDLQRTARDRTGRP